MRGKGKKVVATNDYLRITPAYAGKSNAIAETVKNAGDHPRVCGEKSSTHSTIASWTGITPAYAGKRALLMSFHTV